MTSKIDSNEYLNNEDDAEFESNDDGWDDDVIPSDYDGQHIIPIDKESKNEFIIFKHNTQKCSKQEPILQNCLYLTRLIQGLEYYQALDIKNNDDNDKLMVFVNDIYTNFINDYVHLVSEHSDDLETINNELIEGYQFASCDMKTCNITSRHHATRRDDNNIKKSANYDAALTLFVETFDSLHYYLVHLFDVGLRLKKDASNQINTAVSDQYNDTLGDKNDKFNLKVDTDTPYDDTTKLFMDSMFDYLRSSKIESVEINKLMHVLYDEQEFDTDSLQIDLNYDNNATIDNIQESNVLNYASNKMCQDAIKQYIRSTKLTATSFSIGIIFYYWDYYKNQIEQKEDEINHEDWYNMNDHSGYNISSLYVEPKFASLKEEIFNSKHVDMEQYINDVMFKANTYINTQIARKCKCAQGLSITNLHYGIEPGTSLSISHLSSVILYCDFTTLCTDFSSTFRSIYPSESLVSVRTRNQNYYHLSKLLRESVQLFGENVEGVFDVESNKYINKTKGPYYCGMSRVIVIPEFNIRLCSPTSTSGKIEIATRFAGDYGLIIQLNNNGDKQSALNLRSFNCSWISKYKEEDEHLFFGGDWRIRIQGIRLIKKQKNYDIFLHALFWFDSMINGSQMDVKMEDKINGNDVNIMNLLIQYKLGLNLEKVFEQYVYDMFDLFCIRKNVVVINLYYLDTHFSKLHPLIMHSVEKKLNVSDGKEGKENLLRDVLFELFDNLQRIVIYTTDCYGSDVYAFSLISLLKLIQLKDVKHKIIIKATHRYDLGKRLDRSWLYNAMKSLKEFKETNHEISLGITKNSLRFQEDSVCIALHAL